MKKRKKEIRESFRNSVFERDGYKCVGCGSVFGQKNAKKLLDAHHIMNRKEMPNGGYVKENGISLCKNGCHELAELYHSSFGCEWAVGFHPDDLFVKIGSSAEVAIEKSKELL